MNIEEYAAKHKHYWSNSFENRELKSILDNRKFNRIIDVGCGDGILLYQLNKLGYLDSIHEVLAIDLSEERLKQVRLISGKIKVLQENAQYLTGVPDGRFDLVISTQVIEHVKNDSEMLKSLYRITQPNGIVYIDTVFKQKHGFYFYKNREGERVLDPTHEREYTDTADLIGKVEAANFEVLNMFMTSFRFSPFNFVRRLAGAGNVRVSGSFILKSLARFKVPIPGYKCWKLILRKPL